MTKERIKSEYIRQILVKNDKAVEKAILAIFRRQTEDEQRMADTTHRNNMGFASCDAKLGTYYAKWILNGNALTGRHLMKTRSNDAQVSSPAFLEEAEANGHIIPDGSWPIEAEAEKGLRKAAKSHCQFSRQRIFYKYGNRMIYPMQDGWQDYLESLKRSGEITAKEYDSYRFVDATTI